MCIYIYIYAQNRCLGVSWNCLKVGVMYWFLEISNGQMLQNAIRSHISIFLFLCFTTSSVALLPWRRLMEIVPLSLPSNRLFYTQSLHSGLLSVLAADASLRRQAPEYVSGLFLGDFRPRAFCGRSVCLMRIIIDVLRSREESQERIIFDVWTSRDESQERSIIDVWRSREECQERIIIDVLASRDEVNNVASST